MKIPVSVVVITKNEEKNISAALRSVEEFEDIVVVDAFSDDATVSMARQFTDRVYQEAWRGYSSQKQAAVDHAKNDWVLILDADERMTPELKDEIRKRIGISGVCGYYVPRKNFFLGRWIRHGGWWPDYTLRLFRRAVSRVEQREVHEKVAVGGPTEYLSSPLEHYTYNSISDYIGKMEVYASLSARELSGRKVSPVFSMFASPCFVFLKMFFLRRGFRDGMHGFILAMLYSFYTFVKYAKLWEIKKEG